MQLDSGRLDAPLGVGFYSVGNEKLLNAMELGSDMLFEQIILPTGLLDSKPLPLPSATAGKRAGSASEPESWLQAVNVLLTSLSQWSSFLCVFASPSVKWG